MEYITLNNGVRCPVIGIGTFMLSPADAENSVREALKMGYSLVDTANAYVNERAVGRGMKASGARREDIFLSTKLWPSEYENPNAVDETLARLGVDYVDLLYIRVFAITTARMNSSCSSRPGDRILRRHEANCDHTAGAAALCGDAGGGHRHEV